LEIKNDATKANQPTTYFNHQHSVIGDIPTQGSPFAIHFI